MAANRCHSAADEEPRPLHAAELHAFDIIVLDVTMPFMDGLELTQRLRR